MSKLTKNQKIAYAKVEAAKAYKLSEAAALLKEITFTKFDASVDIDVRLGVGRCGCSCSVLPKRRPKHRLPAPIT